MRHNNLPPRHINDRPLPKPSRWQRAFKFVRRKMRAFRENLSAKHGIFWFVSDHSPGAERRDYKFNWRWAWRHWSGVLHLKRVVLRTEVSWFNWWLGGGVTIGDETDIATALHLGFVSIYTSAAGLVPQKKRRDMNWIWVEHETSFRLVLDRSLMLTVSLWENDALGEPHGLKGYGWGGWTHTVFIMDMLFGPPKYTEENIQPPQHITVPLPEGQYPAYLRIYQATWSRKRWPFPTRLWRADIKPFNRPIPIPGKRTEEDGVYDFTCTVAKPTASCAIACLVENVLSTRQNRATLNWLPAHLPDALSEATLPGTLINKERADGR
jgi:hypothetical protein